MDTIFCNPLPGQLIALLVGSIGLFRPDVRVISNVRIARLYDLLSGGHVTLPIGTFQVLERKRPPLRGWFLNEVRVTYKQRR